MKTIFKILKILDSISSDKMTDESVSTHLKISTFTLIAKLLKYKENEILEEKEFVDFFEERIKKVQHSDEIINLVFQKVIEESLENIPYAEVMLQEDFLNENYTTRRFGYDVLLHLLLEHFTWSDLILTSLQDNHTRFLNFYLFNVIHKFSNKNNKILLHNDKYKLDNACFEQLNKEFDALFLNPQDPDYQTKFVNSYIKLLLFIKYLGIFEVLPDNHEQICRILDNFNKRLYDELKEEIYAGTDSDITLNNLYSPNSVFLKDFAVEIFKRGESQLKKKELLIVLKGEILSKVPLFVHTAAPEPNALAEYIDKEFDFLFNAKQNVYYLQNFNTFLDGILNYQKSQTQNNQEANNAFVNKKDRILLNVAKYGHVIQKLAINLSNRNHTIRKTTLEILNKISPYTFPAPQGSNTETTLLGECDALALCLEVNKRYKIL